MCGGPKNVTSTTNSQPPAYLAGPLQTGANAAVSQFLGNESPMIQSGQNLINQSLAGDFLSPDTNPYIEQTFNRAADLTRTRLDSEFAGSGRNLGAQRPARSEELQTLASNLYGSNFQAERDRQINSLTSAQDYDDLNLLIRRLAGITPGAGGISTSTQPVFRTGLF